MKTRKTGRSGGSGVRPEGTRIRGKPPQELVVKPFVRDYEGRKVGMPEGWQDKRRQRVVEFLKGQLPPGGSLRGDFSYADLFGGRYFQDLLSEAKKIGFGEEDLRAAASSLPDLVIRGVDSFNGNLETWFRK